MSERPTQSHGEWVNEALHHYEGFPEVLALLERVERASAGPMQADIDPLRAVIQPTRVDESVRSLLVADPEMAEIVERLEVLEDGRRSRAWEVLFGPLGVEASPER